MFLKKVFATVLCVILCFALSFTAWAAPVDTKVTVSSVDAMPGDTVVIDVNISNNPGIMAMAFTVTYDSDDLEYKSYSKGYLSNYTVKNHTDKGHVAFVNVENKNIATDGTIISLTFEVKKASKPGKHPITIANSNRDKHGNKVHNIFSDANQNYIVPTVASGGITVAETCENSGHKYGEWNILQNADCTTTGLKNHTCVRCSYLEEVTIPITHDFEAEWTVDKIATPEEDGIMSRHCTKCDAVTDKISFSYEEIGGDDNDDNSSDSSGDNSSSDNSSDNSSTDSDDNSSNNNSSSDKPTTDGSQDTSSNNSSSSTNTDSSQNTPNKKPVINNTVGEKVPLKEVEKLEDYQQNIKPNLDNNAPDKAPQTQEPTDSSNESKPNSSDATVGAIEDNDSNNTDLQEEKPFFATTTGIIMIVLCALISVGIIVLGVVLIIKRKKA